MTAYEHEELGRLIAVLRPAPAGARGAPVGARVGGGAGPGGTPARAAALGRRLPALAEEDARVFRSALSELDRRDDDFKLGRALAQAADAPLQIAETCVDVALLASELAGQGTADLQADARSAAALAAGATRAAAVLVE